MSAVSCTESPTAGKTYWNCCCGGIEWAQAVDRDHIELSISTRSCPDFSCTVYGVNIHRSCSHSNSPNNLQNCSTYTSIFGKFNLQGAHSRSSSYEGLHTRPWRWSCEIGDALLHATNACFWRESHCSRSSESPLRPVYHTQQNKNVLCRVGNCLLFHFSRRSKNQWQVREQKSYCWWAAYSHNCHIASRIPIHSVLVSLVYENKASTQVWGLQHQI